MQQFDLESWTEFKPTIDEIRQKYGYHEFVVGDGQIYKAKNVVLFRGQTRSEWQLKTTLERKTRKSFSVAEYLLQVTMMASEIESYTGTKWDIPAEIGSGIQEAQDNIYYLPRYEYLAYLRHHGYPSPLLDWSASPYIAAYFAMSEQSSEEYSQDQRASVYTYIDKTGLSKSFDRGPIIQVHYPYVRTHKRHFLQKAWYTVALRRSQIQGQHIFCSHHEVFDKSNCDGCQDILIKITLPLAERRSILKDLDDHNINHFTLFQTEDSLIKALSTKDFDMGGT